MTFESIAKQALVKAGMLAPGEALTPELGDLALSDGNLLIQETNIRPLMIWTTEIKQFALTARTLPVYWYTIWPTGADFTAVRPQKIRRANLVLTNSTPPSRSPIEIVDDMQWSDVSTPTVGSSPYPVKLYYDGGYPQPPDNELPRIYLWPYPQTSGNALEIFVDHQSAEFVSVSDTFSFPPGFPGAFMLTLAERVREGFGPISPTLAKSAAFARMRFQNVNSAPPKMSTVDGYSGQNNRNGQGQTWRTGWQ